MDKLQEWIDENCAGQPRARIASRLGVSACYLSQILNGDRKPGRKTQVVIYMATDGAVTPDHWNPLPEIPREDDFVEP